MKRLFKKLKSVLGVMLSVTLVLESSGISAFAAESKVEAANEIFENNVDAATDNSIAEITASGTYCGLTWTINELGGLTITGEYTVAESTEAPWLAYAEQITSAKVTATDVTSTFKWFFGMINLNSVDLSEFDSSKVNNMGYMFYNCSSLTELDLSSFSTNAATSMYGMFQGCSKLTALDMSGFYTSNVKNMGSMFNGCTALTELDLSSFDTGNVTNMKLMFYECSSLTEIVLNESRFHTAKVTDMRQMFYKCSSLTSLDVSGFDTGLVTDMYCMFYECKELTALDVSGFDTSNVIDMSRMFWYCSALTELDVSEFNTANVTNMAGMFNTCSSVSVLDVSKFNTANVTDMDHMFYRCVALSELDMSNFDMTNVTIATDMLSGCTGLTNVNTPKNLALDVTLPSNMLDDSLTEYISLPQNAVTSIELRLPQATASGIYYGMDWELSETGVLVISGIYDAEKIGTSWSEYAESVKSVKVTATGVESTSGWFYNFSNLKSVDFSSFNTSQLKNMNKMFAGCTGLDELDLSGFNTSNVIHMNSVFSYCTSLTKLDISGFNTQKVVDMRDMFENCRSLTRLDLSGFKTPNLMLMNEMFEDCSSLQELDVSSFNTSKVTDITGMFESCSKLEKLDLSSFDLSGLTDESSASSGTVLYKCTALQELNAPKNLAYEVNLPVIFNDENGINYTALPQNQTESLSLKRAVVTKEGTYYGMSWILYESGGLSITGEYGEAADTDTSWLDYADQIVAVKLTATGVQSTSRWFYGMSNLQTIDLNTFDTRWVTDMSYMFYGCSSLAEINVSEFLTARVTTMENMFGGCSELTSLDMSNFTFSSVENVNDMLTGCTKLEQIKAPKNLTADIVLPVVLADADAFEHASLPKNLTKSVLLKKVAIVASGTYYGMNWTINELGGLKVVGTYGEAAYTDTTWINNAAYTDMIISARITATGVQSTDSWFKNMVWLRTVNLTAFDTSQVTDMGGMFYNCTQLTNLDLSNFDTSNVTDMGQMFDGCTLLETLDISSFQTDKVKIMSRMFANCKKLNAVDVSGFYTPNVQTMGSMFYQCSQLTELDLSGFDTRQVTNIENMFYGCTGLTSLDLRSFNLKNLVQTNGSGMLEGCSGLENINTPTNLATDISLPAVMIDVNGSVYATLPKVMETSCVLEKPIVLGVYCGMDWVINKDGKLFVSGSYEDAADTDALWHDYAEQVTSAKITATNVTTTYRWFYNMTMLEQIDFASFDTSKVTNMNGMFNGCSALTSLDLSSFDTSLVQDMSYMFYGCNSLTSIKLNTSKFNTAKVTTMRQMFYKCSALRSVDVSGFDTRLVTDMYCMFYECKALTELDVSKFNTTNVTNMNRMFWYCSALTELNVSGFDTAKVTDMANMFNTCSSLTQLDVSKFETAKVTDMERMFYRCSQLAELNLSNFDMIMVTNAGDMLAECSALKQIQTPVNVSVDVPLPYVFDDGDETGYFVLPKNKTQSILLKKVFAAGTYYGMGWLIDESGKLCIWGSYGNSSDKDTFWTDYAEQITSAKIKATGILSTAGWFKGMSNLTEVDLSSFDTSYVTDMSFMFFGCTKLTNLDVSAFNTAKVVNTEKMFYHCYGLESLDLSNFDLSSLNNASDMLGGCTSLSYIKTPKNVNIDIVLPKELEDKERTIYTVLPKNLEESIVLTHVIYRIAVVEDQTYTGKAIKPEVTVYKGNRVLTLGVDYTVSYKNNKNVADKGDKKAPTITVKGKNNYMGTLTQTFTIKPKELTEENTVVAPMIVASNGKEQKFKSTVKVDGKKLKLKKEYEVETLGVYKDPGKYTVTIKGTGNYSGSVKATLIILAEKQVAAAKLKVGKIGSFNYADGVPVTPNPKITYKNKELVLGKDYAIEYKNNDKAGKATLIIKGLENVSEDGTYVIGSISKTFVINGINLKKAEVKYQDSIPYTGEAICPEVTVTLDGASLKLGSDYIVEYAKNLNVGKGSITIKGCGGYTGTIKKSFSIVVDETVDARIAIGFKNGASAYYTQGGAKPEMLVRLDNKALKLGKDYTVSYKNNKKIAAEDAEEAPTVIVKGKGNYKFAKEIPFAILPCPVSELDITVQDKFLGDKKGYLSVPVVKDGKKKLKAGRDYTIVGYKLSDGTEFEGTEDVANDTTVTVTIEGMGNYTKKIDITYRIATKSVSKVKITAKPLAYNEGKSVFYSSEDINNGLLVITDKATGKDLCYGVDYKIVGYTNNTKNGTATVTIRGCGEYGGTKTVKFKIVQYKLR